MKLILAVSRDGFVARGPTDDMTWTGPLDKFAFKLLTLSDGQPLYAGRVTFESLPPLKGRTVRRISRDGREGSSSLEQAWTNGEEAWLIGGPSIAEAALHAGYVNRVFLCVVPEDLGSGIALAPLLRFMPEKPEMVVKFGDYEVRVYAGLTVNGP